VKQIPIKLGPLALILAVISICLTTLSILTFTTARADWSLAEKYAQTVSDRYELEVQGQEFLRDAADGSAAPGDPDAEGVYWTVFEKDGARLQVGLEADGTIASWRHEKEWTLDTDIGNLWTGIP